MKSPTLMQHGGGGGSPSIHKRGSVGPYTLVGLQNDGKATFNKLAKHQVLQSPQTIFK